MFDEKALAVIRIRAELLHSFRCWFRQNGYIEVSGPTLLPAVGDWPGSFEVKYFDKKVYLAQGLQPYTNAFVTSLGKIYTIAPTFRAEKISTERHLTEYWRIEAAQQCKLDTIIEIQEKLIANVLNSLSEEAMETLKYFQRSPEDLTKIKIPFPKLTYDDAIDLLQRDDFKVFWGQKIDFESESHISSRFHQPFFIMKFPMGVETFFLKSDPVKPELTLSADLLAPEGYGEIGSGGQAITEKRILFQKLIEEKIDLADRSWYMDLLQSNSHPYSGFAFGLERLIQWICKFGHIKEATTFPRMSDRIYP